MEQTIENNKMFMSRAVQLSLESVQSGTGGPFGCVIVKDGLIIAEGKNSVTKNNDPSAHAEVEAIRTACKALSDYQLTDCIIYTSCEPCPMCLGAIYWARPKAVYYANSKQDAANAGFDDSFIYEEIEKAPSSRSISFSHLPDADARKAFDFWNKSNNKITY